MPLMLRLYSALSGRKIGADRFGNVYFEAKRKLPVYGRSRRWVIYAGAAEATTVPPEWHAWLHHTTDAPLSETKRYAWQQEHQPNLTGTPAAYRPPGHDYVGGRQRSNGGDYEAWTPGS
jgi:NADH:ubiquinone oxidoreductase subunit